MWLCGDGLVYNQTLSFWLLLILGLEQEGIYRLSGMKSKIDELKAAYDRGECMRACTFFT